MLLKLELKKKNLNFLFVFQMYKKQLDAQENALVDSFTARVATAQAEHHEQLAAYVIIIVVDFFNNFVFACSYHQYRQRKIQAMHLLHMQQLLERHQSQRVALQLKYVDLAETAHEKV